MNIPKSISFIYGKDLVKDKALANAIGIVTFIILISLGAYVRIPLGFTPVPITLQTFFVILAGAILGKKLGVLSQAGYIALGVLGLPIFAGAGFGLAYLAGPTGGYLAGFLASAFLIGHLIEFKESVWWKVLTFVFGLAAIYIPGVLWLAFVLNVSAYNAVLLGVVPFMPGAILKLALALSIYLKFGTRLKRIFSV